MTISDDLLQPLSSEELDELEDFLLSDVHGEKSMTLDMLDGFLASLAVGPSVMMPDDWLPMVFDVEGQEEPAFASKEQGERILSLITRYMNAVAAVFENDPDVYLPLYELCSFDDPEEESLAIRAWTLGFILGMEIRWDEWQPVFDAVEETDNSDVLLLSPIFALSGSDEDMPELTEAELETWRDLIPDSVSGLYRFWQNYREG
ncbi:MAG: UPF0149 family protein [Chlorobium sp.]|uniref:UPF0149 family protein n=1 Tax=Chlorobium sp. TaxID=1095 RepID=UPI0025C36169|nr:UPF0149 family protein [Chlorobium sp.]MCF8217160.1 UPF0149 family protein [Chlorobium sp.]MCF8271995.1 UPF0149 family protein [Chlorobium sp.]MCF8288378.1 UPF0149 family protein [Chlorobium sp.]MCF8291957.1 UPF0149 family protein [Chlorobium sp.]MCF8386077.1 UPF0149 family protein [Chlorobium sp.]